MNIFTDILNYLNWLLATLADILEYAIAALT